MIRSSSQACYSAFISSDLTHDLLTELSTGIEKSNPLPSIGAALRTNR
jgi:hypothetical protein